jgi:hypothetical protein
MANMSVTNFKGTGLLFRITTKDAFQSIRTQLQILQDKFAIPSRHPNIIGVQIGNQVSEMVRKCFG